MKKALKKRRTSRRTSSEPAGDVLAAIGFRHVREKRDPLFAPPPLITETVFFSRVGHTFGKLPPWWGPPTLYLVQDFLLDQTGTSGADGALPASKAFDLTTAVSYRFNLWPKDRSRLIKVVPPPTGPVFFGLDIGRRFVNAVSDYSDQYAANSFFVNLMGPSPVFTYNSFFIGHNTNHWIQFVVMADVAATIAFNGFVSIGTYPPRSFDPGTKSYLPFSTSVPFNLQTPNSVPYVMFSYLTPDPVDPGPFVTLS